MCTQKLVSIPNDLHLEPASIREQSSPRFAYETHSDVRSENVDWDEQNRSTDREGTDLA